MKRQILWLIATILLVSPVLLTSCSNDDPWSAGIPTNVGPNVKLVINPIGRHSPYLNDPKLCPAETRQEVMNFVSTYIF